MTDLEEAELGAFRLEEPIGRGGMATVWRGIHRVEGVPVAIKLVTADDARERTYREALENEVRAMARLDHRGIVVVLDYGQVPGEAAERSSGRLAAGSPYLVMELADRGSLQRGQICSWDGLRAALVALLEALGHAHARGVIHRDIKPSNVLVHGPSCQLRLSDFGIAHALERARQRERGAAPVSAGTAWFMAPEQILGLARDEGPWTDLYSLGCLAYLLASGGLPFGGRDREAVYRAHCLAEVPALRPTFEVPRDFEAWLGVLMAKRPRDRFEMAADARRALDALGGAMLPPDEAARPSPEAGPPTASETEAATSASAPGTLSSAVGSEDPTRLERSAGRVELEEDYRGALADQPADGALERAALRDRLREDAVPPVPDAPAEGPRPRPPRLLGIGLGVYGLRPIPLAGREEQRAALWRDLVTVASERRARAVIVRGRAGYGKTRLAEWLVEQTAELGAAHTLWVHHEASPAPLDGVTRMMQRFVRGEGLEGGALEQRIVEAVPQLSERERGQLAALMTSSGERPRATRREERFAVARDFLIAIGERRPAILVFDDAQLGEDSIAFVSYLLRLRANEAPPAFSVLTVREEALEDRPVEAEALARLSERDRCRDLAVGPLAAPAHAQLVSELLGLEPSLAERVAERTAGNPLFAVQLVGDWVQRGTLVAEAEGFTLRDDAEAVVPDDIHSLWGERIDRLVASVPAAEREAAQQALSLMALLGRQVDRREWEHACAEAGVIPPDGLLDAMALRRLALVGRQRFSLVHAMLHESLERRTRERGAWEALQDACATTVLARHGHDRAQSERLANHLIEAGRWDEALPALLAAADVRLVACEFAESRAVADRYDAVLDRMGVAQGDRRRAKGWLHHAEVLGTQAHLDECDRYVARAEPIALATGDRAILAAVRRLQAATHLKRGQLSPAIRFCEEGRALTRELGDRRSEGLCLHGLGECYKLVGRLDDSEAAYEEACRCFEEEGERLGYGRSCMGLADVQRRRGLFAEAVRLLEESTDLMRRVGNRHSEGVGLNSLGDIARIEGDLALARRHYRESLRVFDAIASEEATIVRLNLALVLLAQRDFAGAREVFEATRPELGQAGREGYLSYTVAGLFATAAGMGDLAALEPLHEELVALLGMTGLVDDDIASTLETAGDLAREHDAETWARVAWQLAQDQWRGLSRQERLDAVVAKLAVLTRR